MSELKTGNEPINPTYFKDGEMDGWGLTKREYYAGLAMQGMVANIKTGKLDDILEIPGNVAKWSVAFADELLKTLETEHDGK